jgi:Icc-related predicted phosphoesterase
MKILAIGDFHGKLPKDLKEKCKKIDLIVSIGDYPPFSLRKEFFKHSYGKEIELWEVIGKKKVKKAELKDIKEGDKLLKKLNSLNIQIITVSGNIDRTKWRDAADYKKSKWKWSEQDFFTPLIKKYSNIKDIDYSYAKFKDYVFIGMARSTFPGKIKSRRYKNQRRRLEKLFNRFSKELENNKVIFVSHNVPYNTKIDLITAKEAHKKAKGKHYGSKLVRRIIEKYQPLISIAGHIHESQGKDKIGKTVIINTDEANKEQAVLIDIDENNSKIRSIKFFGKKKK